MSLVLKRAVLLSVILISHLRAEPAIVVSLATVGDCIRAQNPILAAARLQIQEALGRMNQSGLLANPDLQTAIDQNSRSREGRVEVGISQRFPFTDRLRLEKQVSLTRLKSSEAEVREVERQLIGQAREALVKVLASRQRRDLLRQQSAVLKEFADFLSQAAAKGEGSALDAGQAKLAATGLATEIRQLDATEMALYGELKPLLGMRSGEALSVSGTLPDANLPSTSVDPTKRPDLQAAELEAFAAAQGVSLEQLKRYDDVEAGLFVAAERIEDAPNGFENEATLGVRFRIALPFWNKNEGAIQEAQAKKIRKEREAIALGRGIRLAAEAARNEMLEWVKMIGEIDQTLLPLADEQTKLTEEAYRSGQGEIQSVLRSREKRLELAAARLDALRGFHLARVRHETALAKP